MYAEYSFQSLNYRKARTLSNVIEKTTGPVSVRYALDMLYDMEIRDHVQFGEHWYTIPALDACFQEFKAEHAPAHSVRITFWGGPPGKEDWINGTLRMFLLDHLFRIEADNGVFDMLIDLVNERTPHYFYKTLRTQ